MIKNLSKPIRLIETFAGYGSQLIALKAIGANVESYCISEWEINANASYFAVHTEDDTDYSKGMTKDELIDALLKLSISANGKTPMTRSQISRKGEKWLQKVYNQFKANNNLGSICNIHGKDLKIDNTDEYLYLLTYSFPCTDLSLAGRRAGMNKGSGTSSSLLWEIERILQELKDSNLQLPQVLLMENVPQVFGDSNIDNFNVWCDFLESLGYTNTCKILNAKDYGLAQNRKRCFMFSFLENTDYEFPNPIPLSKRLKDYLESNVDESYYINNDKAKKLIEDLITREVLNDTEPIIPIDGTINSPKAKDIANTLTAKDRSISNRRSENNLIVEQYTTPKVIGQMEGTFESTNRVYSIEGVCPTLNTCGGGDRQPKILVDDTTGFDKSSRVYKDVSPTLRSQRNGLKILECESTIVAMRGRNPDNPSCCIAGMPTEQRLEPNLNNICNTLTSVQKDNLLLERNFTHNYRLRKLTETECGRLMGVSDADILKMKAYNSKSQLYKQFGNSIAIPCLIALFSQLGLNGVKKWNDGLFYDLGYN